MLQNAKKSASCRPFQNSPIPFVLAEALTNGTGDIVDLVCRFLNPAAAALLQLAPEEVQDRRLSQFAPLPAAGVLAPVQAVAGPLPPSPMSLRQGRLCPSPAIR